MAVRRIVLLGDPILRAPAGEVVAFDDALGGLVEDMFETMYHAEGVGLAAPQIGIAQRVLVIDVRDEGDPQAGRLVLVNPRVVVSSAELAKEAEGCLSIPGLEEVVERPAGVSVEGFDAAGEPVSVDAADLLARAIQHEIDHLDGILFLDRVSPIKRRMLLRKWKKLQEGEKAAT